MNIKNRLVLLSFLQFFIWGSWLISVVGYLFTIKDSSGISLFQGSDVGNIFSTLGIASLIMPALLGIVADRWMNAERLLGLCHLAGGVFLLWASTIREPQMMFMAMLLNSLAYMPTIALNNSVSYRILVQSGLDVQKTFPPIRVWGTIGFICAMWFVDVTGFGQSHVQFYVAAAVAFGMGMYCFSLPACPPGNVKKGSWRESLGLDAFLLLKDEKMLVFFLFSLLLGAALQITNMWGDMFIGDFGKIDEFKDNFFVKHRLILLSLSQISETLFILTIPFFLKRFGIKMVMLFSMMAWVFRFGLFSIGDPGSGLIFLVMSMIVYGMAFDFFNISGSLFVEKETPSNIRASAQGLFMMLTNGVGAILGSKASGWVVDHFTQDRGTLNEYKDWSSIWLVFAGYALLLVLVFPVLFRYRHVAEDDPDTLKSRH